MKKTAAAVAFLLLFSGSRAQNPAPAFEQLTRQLFNAFKYNDTALFVNCFITNKDANHLLYQYIRLNQIKDTGSFAQIEMPDLRALMKKEYIVARKQFADSGVQWNGAQYNTAYYNLLKDKNSVYPSGLGEVLFTSDNRLFSIVLPDAVFINGEWKLVSFRPARGTPVQPTRVAYFTEQDALFQMHNLGTKPSSPAKPVPPKKTTPKIPQKQ